MDRAAYRDFLDRVVEHAARHAEVIGVVALGSTADRSRSPDEWSDHDVWVVTRDGHAAALRDDRAWLPAAERIVGYFAETVHGRSVVYDDGHLLELAVFDDRELEVARANDYRVLYDTGGIASRVEAIAQRTEEAPADSGAVDPSAQLVVSLLIGLGRYGRGELLSANDLIGHRAVGALLRLIADCGDEGAATLDDLDPYRRVERVEPETARRVLAARGNPIPDLAATLFDIARSRDATSPALSPEVGAAVTRAIERARAARPASPLLHHVQLAMPAGGEPEARRFYGDVLGLPEVAKPEVLAQRGGCWFRGETIEVHLGVADPFVPASKAHPGILVSHLDALAARLDATGHRVTHDPHFPGHRRFYTDDPFGNRLEFLERL